MKAFECYGQWWLPQGAAEAVAGKLCVSTTGDLKLSVFRSLGPSQESAGGKYHPIVLGSVSENPLGATITLANCFRTGYRTAFPGGMRQEDYFVARGLFGAHLTQNTDFAFRRLDLRLGGLDEWAHSLSGFEQGLFPDDAAAKFPLLLYSMPAAVRGPIPGGQITLGVSLTSGGVARSPSFQEEVGLSIVSESPKSEIDLNEAYAFPLQNLMTFACDRAQTVERFRVWRLDVAFPAENNPEIQVVGARVQPEDAEAAEPVRRVEMLFTYADVESDFAAFVGRWLRMVDVYSDACNLFFGLQYAPPAYIANKFLTVTQCLAVYHARRADGMARRADDERRLRGILSSLGKDDAQWILDRLGARPYPPIQVVLSELLGEHSDALNPLISNGQSGFVNEVTNTLHYVIRRDPEVGLAASHGADLHWMTEKLRFLVKACFLHEVGFPPTKIGALFDRNILYQHIRQQEAMRAAARKGS